MPASREKDLVYRATIQGSTYFYCPTEKGEREWGKKRKDKVAGSRRG
jgi:hypothetical protein